MGTVSLNNRRWRVSGLTFGEMLVVLAVFSLLAVMFFFSSSHALVKTRISRALSEGRTISLALKNYESDYSDIPTEDQGIDPVVKNSTALLTKIPLDPFTGSGKEARQYIYLADIAPNIRWLVVSVGPDGKSDLADKIQEIRKKKNLGLTSSGWPRQPLLPADEARELIKLNTYDPTNGSVSGGDIVNIYGQ